MYRVSGPCVQRQNTQIQHQNSQSQLLRQSARRQCTHFVYAYTGIRVYRHARATHYHVYVGIYSVATGVYTVIRTLYYTVLNNPMLATSITHNPGLC